MRERVFFTVGPTQLYPGVKDWIRQAVSDDLLSISHRSTFFKDLFRETVESVRKVLKLPDGYEVVFLGSATEAMERIIQSGSAEHTLHLVNGSFSRRFYDIARRLGRQALKIEVSPGEGFDPENVSIPGDTEMVCITYNETSTGVAIDEDFLRKVREKAGSALITLDVVSIVPCEEIDFSLVDCAFFSVQKGFGLPAGLGVVIYNQRFLEKTVLLDNRGLYTGGFHSINMLHRYYVEDQTPETPNVLLIYLLSRVCECFLEVGLEKIQQDVQKKAQLIYRFFEESELFRPFVNSERFRSKTILIADVFYDWDRLYHYLVREGFVVGKGYRGLDRQQIRIANFPAHSIEMVERLLASLKKLER